MFHLINISSFRARSFSNEVVFVILHIGPLFAIRYMVLYMICILFISVACIPNISSFRAKSFSNEFVVVILHIGSLFDSRYIFLYMICILFISVYVVCLYPRHIFL